MLESFKSYFIFKKPLFLLALLIRISVLFIGETIDSTPGLHYTDIDYSVFSDAADHIVHGNSPYDRPTYRYPPLLAYLLIPNYIFGRHFGKLLFVLFDSLTGILIHELTKGLNHDLMVSLLWDFNPFVINISTRGNSDSLTCFLLVLTIYLLRKNHNYIAAIMYGISVHLRIFPIFFVFQLFFHLKYQIIPFGIISFLIFSALNFQAFTKYGYKFIYETYFYHLTRKDYQHNFAAPWLSVYLGYSPGKIWGIMRIILFFLISMFKFQRLELCWTLIVIAFIGYNTVCTVQYFDWAFALLALIPDCLCNRRFIASTIIWLFSHLSWLGIAYLLEFCGKNVYEFLWSLSCLIFISNNLILISLSLN